jgi:dihydrofolate reductase
MIISIITAMTTNKVIGSHGDLPWKIPNELKYFRETTLNKAIIMGGNTFRSINSKPLPNRFNIVLTKSPDKFAINQLTKDYKNLSFVTNITDSLKQAEQHYAISLLNSEIMIIGGAEIYKQFLPLANKLYLSIIKSNYSGDIYFPEFNIEEWKLDSSEEHEEFVAKILSKII